MSSNTPICSIKFLAKDGFCLDVVRALERWGRTKGTPSSSTNQTMHPTSLLVCQSCDFMVVTILTYSYFFALFFTFRPYFQSSYSRSTFSFSFSYLYYPYLISHQTRNKACNRTYYPSYFYLLL